VGLVAVMGGPPLMVGEVHGDGRVLRNTRLPTRLTGGDGRSRWRSRGRFGRSRETQHPWRIVPVWLRRK
jgi:hypothetical protein